MIQYLRILLLTCFIFISHIQVFSQDENMICPPEIKGDAFYIPFPVAIALDGDLSDWEKIPEIKVEKGTFISPSSAENGYFVFKVAADMDNLYVTMQMPDINIISGQHGEDYWNEDSFEFFLNCSGDLDARLYAEKIFQVNISAIDIGRDDLKLTLTGTGLDTSVVKVKGKVFKTDDGWGYEAAVALDNLIAPEHGLEIGFQAQMNGATKKDRDVKLIWSNSDPEDKSWQNPRFFGRALFFKVGSTDIPEPEYREPIAKSNKRKLLPLNELPKIRVNQTGYYPKAKKRAIYVCEDTASLDWHLLQRGDTLISGKTVYKGLDAASEDVIHLIDFSSFQNEGIDYVLQVGEDQSFYFDIGNSIYKKLKTQSMSYFYLNRSGIPIEKKYTERGNLARAAGHMTDEKVGVYHGTDAQGKKWPERDYFLNVQRGWYDAGDYGKYVVNGGISVWTLLNMYERNPEMFTDGSLPIPENDNEIPDVLDEVRWEMDFILNMQVPKGQPQEGMAHHKVHELKWDGFPLIPPTKVKDRYAMPPTTAATLNLAAVAAQSARIWKNIDEEFSNRCLSAAETAWEAALKNPNVIIGNVPGDGGGNYDDSELEDEFYWAACELYLTTGHRQYKRYIKKSRFFVSARILKGFDFSPMSWMQMAMLGRISLLTVENNLSKLDMKKQKTSIILSAKKYMDEIHGEGYLVPMKSSYVWGSNSFVLNKAIILAYAFEITGDSLFLDGVTECMNYIMGRNALCKSFVSSYGENPLTNPHHRYWANEDDVGFPAPPPGVVAGGPNETPTDEPAKKVRNWPRAKRYVDHVESYTTNEVTINWNSPLAWVVHYLQDKYN